MIYKFYVNALYVALTRAIHNVYLMESDTGHALLGLLNLAPGGKVSGIDTQASSVQDWQKEARKLALQGKQEQADAIERLILKTCAPPSPIFDEARLRDTLAKVYLEQAPGNKSKSLLYDYATCYDEPLLAEMLADELGFEQARNFERLAPTQGRRPYLPYFSRNFKDILGQCDKYGVEHRNSMNQTPLMAAAAAGNVPLLEALLARGADSAAVDHFGRNALHWAIATALRDRAYAATAFSAVFRLVAPACVDVMAGERLIRIDRHQSEYLFFQIMWVLFRQCFGTAEMSDRGGIDGAMLQDAFERLPGEVVAPERTKRAYISGVLARNEVAREYAYNRRLFKRLWTGVYQFSPALSVRRRGAEGDAWVPVFAALNLALVKETCDHHYVDHIDQLLMAGQLAPAPEPMSMAYLRTKRLAQLHIARPQAAATRKAPKK